MEGCVMPVLELGDIREPNGRYWAWITVQSVMAWPSDKKERDAFLVSHAANVLGPLPQWFNQNIPRPIEAGAAQRNEWKIASQVIKKEATLKFDQAGGFTAAAFSPGLISQNRHMENISRDWFSTGLVLKLVWSMDQHHSSLRGGASVKKALYILDNINLPMTSSNAKYLSRAWSKYRPVAHLCAALYDIFSIAADGGKQPDVISAEVRRMLLEDFDVFLAFADAYQNFGLSYRPQHTKSQTILDSGQTWLLPKIKQWAPYPHGQSPLDAGLLKIASNYMA